MEKRREFVSNVTSRWTFRCVIQPQDLLDLFARTVIVTRVILFVNAGKRKRNGRKGRREDQCACKARDRLQEGPC